MYMIYVHVYIYIYVHVYIYTCIYIYTVQGVNSLNNYSAPQNQNIKVPNWNLQLLGHFLAFEPSEGQPASQVSKNPPV